MEHWFLLYLLTRMDSIQALAIITLLFGAIGWVVVATLGRAFVNDFDENGKMEPMRARSQKLLGAVAIIAIPFVVLVPSQKDLFFIVGGAVVLEAAQSERAKTVASDSVAVVEKWLREQLKEEK
jgi:hypothetical protein